KGRSYAFSSQENALIDRIEALASAQTPAFLQLDTKDFATLLPALVDNPNITFGKSSEATVVNTPLKLPLRATLEPNGEIVLSLKNKLPELVMIGDWVCQNGTFLPLSLPPEAKDIFRSPVRVPRSQVPQFLGQRWPQLQAAGGVEANFKLEDFT